jgi:hypothetical protein
MQHIQTILVLSIIFLFQSFSTFGQISQDSLIYRVETRDKNIYTGTILYLDTEIVRLKTNNLGELTIQRSDIERMSPMDSKIRIGTEFWFENPQATKYFWGANGYNLRPGEAFYQNTWVMFNQFTVGVTDNFSIGAGFIPLFLFAGAPTPVWITPKVSFPVKADKFHLGAGAFIGTILGDEVGGYGLLYGISTIGSRDKNITFGLGYGFADGELAKTPYINISGMIRTGERGYFLTENYYVDGVAVLSFGGRTLFKGTGLDYGLLLPFGAGSDVFVGIPWLGITIPIGKTGKDAMN